MLELQSANHIWISVSAKYPAANQSDRMDIVYQ
jgi:hypothetical protein